MTVAELITMLTACGDKSATVYIFDGGMVGLMTTDFTVDTPLENDDDHTVMLLIPHDDMEHAVLEARKLRHVGSST